MRTKNAAWRKGQSAIPRRKETMLRREECLGGENWKTGEETENRPGSEGVARVYEGSNTGRVPNRLNFLDGLNTNWSGE